MLMCLLQGPTITEVFPPQRDQDHKLFSATMCIPKTKLYESINDLRKVGAAFKLLDDLYDMDACLCTIIY